jgi:hypothetical protein
MDPLTDRSVAKEGFQRYSKQMIGPLAKMGRPPDGGFIQQCINHCPLLLLLYPKSALLFLPLFVAGS